MQETPVGAHGDSNGFDNDTIHPRDAPPSLPQLCAQIHDKMEAFLTAEPKDARIAAVQAQSRTALGIIQEALSTYSLDELSISYNGGKDCLVLLILYLSALHAHYSKPLDSNGPANDCPPPSRVPATISSVYIVMKHPFPLVDEFVATSSRYYHLSVSHYSKPMKEAFSDYLHDHPNIRAIFVGTRRTDPHGSKLRHFDPTDRGWPDFMRIHPVIDWHYAEIWTFIRELAIPYCSLYDLGYTSLGSTTDTHPNPALQLPYADESGPQGYRPAYELLQDDEERLGRD